MAANRQKEELTALSVNTLRTNWARYVQRAVRDGAETGEHHDRSALEDIVRASQSMVRMVMNMRACVAQ